MANAAASKRKETKPSPSHKVRIGATVATVWPNEPESSSDQAGYPWYNTTLVRVFTNDRGEYMESSSFAENQLLEAIAAAQMAHQWIVEQHAKDRAERRQGNSN
jgi:hypothetical protein